MKLNAHVKSYSSGNEYSYKSFREVYVENTSFSKFGKAFILNMMKKRFFLIIHALMGCVYARELSLISNAQTNHTKTQILAALQTRWILLRTPRLRIPQYRPLLSCLFLRNFPTSQNQQSNVGTPTFRTLSLQTFYALS